MAVTKEDGTVIANADVYEDVAGADAYWVLHGTPAEWTAATTDAKEVALRYATSYLDSKYRWNSSLVDLDQTLGWPRVAYNDSEGRCRGGSTMPSELLAATSELALEHVKGTLTLVTTNNDVEKKKIGDSETTFKKGGSRVSVTYPYAYSLLTELGVLKTSSRRIVRG